jgi:hypothetical protein
MGVSKKKSGWQRRAWERLNTDPASAFYGVLRSGKRGRPRGETDEARRGMIELDFLWLVAHGAPAIGQRRWSDSRIANELLLDDRTRQEKYKLDVCRYRGVSKETLRRLITAARNKFYAAKTPLRVRT